MTLKNDKYTYRVTWSEDDNKYVGLCAEFPSLSWLADTPEKALKGGRKLVADILLDMGINEMNQFLNLSHANTIAESLWSGFLLTCTGNWLYRPLNPMSASIVLPAPS